MIAWGLLILIPLVFLALAVWQAPLGREDESGFHRDD